MPSLIDYLKNILSGSKSGGLVSPVKSEPMVAMDDGQGGVKYVPSSLALGTGSRQALPQPARKKLSDYVSPSPKPSASPTPSLQQYKVGNNQGRSQKYSSANKPSTQAAQKAIIDAAGGDPILAQLMLDIAAQESMLGQIQRTSGYHPTQRSASGLFQFTAPTWEEGIKRYGADMGLSPITAPQYSDEWVRQIEEGRMNDYLNAVMAANFIRGGMLSRWDASKGVWGSNYTPEELSKYRPN